ncbi:hypothetical protein [Azospirillum himalayense]|uniref:HEAT repeat domain-containing protein n=1 Tax=Azospirillum himalayense TaxID=654847 RepID=A0ABW0GHA4_9PROT
MAQVSTRATFYWLCATALRHGGPVASSYVRDSLLHMALDGADPLIQRRAAITLGLQAG